MVIETRVAPDDIVQFFRNAAEQLKKRSPKELAREDAEITRACIAAYNEYAPRQAQALMRFADHRYKG